MTFNSFMMLFVYVFIPTSSDGNAWKMVKPSIRRQYKVNQRADGNRPPQLKDNDHDVKSSDTYLTLDDHEYVSVSDEVINAHNDKVERYKRFLKGVRYNSDHELSIDHTTGQGQDGRFLIACIEDCLVRDPVTDHIIAADSGEIEWTDAHQGVLDVFSRIGNGGTWDLAITYAMAMNIVCTAYAFLINLRAMGQQTDGEQNSFGQWLSIVSTASIGTHFLVSLFLYMFTKLYRTQRLPHASPRDTVCRSIVAIVLGLVDLGTVSITLLMIFVYWSKPDDDAIWHGKLKTVPRAWADAAPYWLATIIAGMGAQAMLVLQNGTRLVAAQKAIEDRVVPGVLVTTQNLNKHLTYQLASDSFQNLAFNCWLMPLVLTVRW